MFNPLMCEKCGRELPQDDAIAIIEGICAACRQSVKALAQPLRADQLRALREQDERERAERLRQYYEPTPIEQPEALGATAPSPAPAGTTPREKKPIVAPRPVPPPPSAGAPHGQSDQLEELIRELDKTSLSPRPTLGSTSWPPRQDMPDFRPPALPIPIETTDPIRPPEDDTSARDRRRRRDLGLGIAVGLLVTVAIAGHFLREQPKSADLPLAGTGETRKLLLRVSPPSAVVTLDGRKVGPADAWGRLTLPRPVDSTDDPLLVVSAEGYHEIRQPLSSLEGVPESFIRLVRMPIEMAVSTDPPDAEIWMNGELKGRSPLSLTIEPASAGELVVRKAGYADLKRKIEPPDTGRRLALDLALEPVGPIVRVVTEPPGAQVEIGGELRGVSPVTVQLDPDYLGRQIEVVAAAAGYEPATLSFPLPDIGGGEPVAARLLLRRLMSRMIVRTDPPGGRVTVAGKDFGPAPAEIQFDPAQTGNVVVIKASKEGAYFGRESVTIPPAGTPVDLTIPLAFNAQRVVFVVATPFDIGPEHYALTDRLASRIHDLRPSQRFSIVSATDEGVRVWPGEGELKAATSEQKVRAYDAVRSIRPSLQIDHAALLQAAMSFEPTTVWLFVEGDLEAGPLDAFSQRALQGNVSVNVVRVEPGPEDEWLARWTTQHHGTLTVLNETPLPVAAINEDDSE